MNSFMTYIRSIHPMMYWVKLPKLSKTAPDGTIVSKSKKHQSIPFKRFKEEYLKQLRVPTKDESTYLHTVSLRVDRSLGEYKLPLLRAVPWKFLISAPHVEFGFPFTLGDTIVIPEHKVTQIDAETLLHEKIHIYQRMNPTLFHFLYESLFLFVKKVDPKTIDIPDDIRMTEMTNPDDNGDIWMYYDKGTWYYPSLQLGTSRLTVEMGYPIQHYTIPMRVRMGGQRLLRSLSILNGFPANVSIYHPNEIFACLLSHQIITGKKISKSITKILNQDEM
jgi:hypothetical protein